MTYGAFPDPFPAGSYTTSQADIPAVAISPRFAPGPSRDRNATLSDEEVISKSYQAPGKEQKKGQNRPDESGAGPSVPLAPDRAEGDAEGG
jgi:hypothetical protein